MKQQVKGSMTVTLSLSLFVFLSFCLVLLEGVHCCYLKMEGEAAAELAGFSALSEYRKELLDSYGLFFVDLNYGDPQEDPEFLRMRMQNYLEENAKNFWIKDLEVSSVTRATDGKGEAFFRQSIQVQKESVGLTLVEKGFEEYLGQQKEDSTDFEEMVSEAEDLAQSFAEDSWYSWILPQITIPSSETLLRKVVGDAEISEKSISLKQTIGNRKLKKGNGIYKDRTFLDRQLFFQYLLDHFGRYGQEEKAASKEALEYQMEYVICGKSTDKENLKQIIMDIFLLRAISNYFYIQQSPSIQGKLEEKAFFWTGIFLSPELTEVVKELLEFAEAISMGIEDVKEILQGEELPVYGEDQWSSWKMGYEEYLYLFLNMMPEEQWIYRSMDVIEQEVRKTAGYEGFCMDHCTDRFTVEWIYGFYGIYSQVFWEQKDLYEEKIKKEVFYDI